MVYEVGELVKWKSPLDSDYSYGYILEIKRNLATVIGTGYYSGVTTQIHLRYIDKAKKGGGGCGRDKKYSKRSAP